MVQMKARVCDMQWSVDYVFEPLIDCPRYELI